MEYAYSNFSYFVGVKISAVSLFVRSFAYTTKHH